MRVYFMQAGRIRAVEFLTSDTDEARIAEARKLFGSSDKARDADGFEVWDGGRFIYRYPETPE